MNIKQWLLPKKFFLGILIGFSLCVVLGMIVSHHDRLHHFVRFFRGIQPQQQFFATNFQLINIASHQVNKNKILVLIGGSSIFKGVGQNRNDLWSLQLQKLLDDRFVVLNYAIDGASLRDFGGVAFRMLKERYSKIIFVSTCQSGVTGSPDGQSIFRYLFWDGYYHHLFHLEKSEKQAILNLQKQELKTASGLEMHLASFLDSLFYFKSLWTWVGYHSFFTVWEDLEANDFVQAREKAQDTPLDLPTIRKQQQADPAFFQQEIDFLNRMISSQVDLEKTPLTLRPEITMRMNRSYDQAFPQSFRKNMLCVLTDENPDHLAHLSKKAQLADKDILNDANQLLIHLGYHSIIVGEDFVGDDFHDVRHFAKGGGAKTAAAVAVEVKAISKILHYS